MPQPARFVRVDEPSTEGFMDEAKLKLVFRARVLNLCAEKGWTPAELARRAGLGRDLVSTYLRDPPRSLPTGGNLLKIAQALHCQPGELLPSATELAAHVPALQIVGQDETGYRVKVNIPISGKGLTEMLALIEREAGAGAAGRRQAR